MLWKKEYERLKTGWSVMTFYERFEQVVALLLTFAISIVIVVALYELGREVWGAVTRTFDPLEHAVFQRLFGQIMTLLIALEFKHSILRVVARKESIIQVKTILLIALLALARKFIILDIAAVSAATIAALAATVVALSVSYWLIRERDDRLERLKQ